MCEFFILQRLIVGFYEANSASGKTDLIFLLGDIRKDLNLFLEWKATGLRKLLFGIVLPSINSLFA